MHLNLDPSFNPFEAAGPGLIQFESFTFSGGELHIKIDPRTVRQGKVIITHRLNSFADIGLLILAVDALRRMGIQNIDCLIPYFPAARQDRVMVKGEPLSVQVYAQLINALKFDKVYIYDPHSDVTPALLDNAAVITNHQFVAEVMKVFKGQSLVSPDGGALKKIYKVSEYLGGVNVVECSKKRNVATGMLTEFKVYEDSLEGQDCLVVDDICDGGGTFIGLAKKLKELKAGKIGLAVSHGIFSKGFDVLTQHYDMIFTTNSVKDIKGVEKLIQINLTKTII